MKAVFVIDLPVALENLLGEELLLYISHKDDRYIMTEESKLRPLPQKKETDIETDLSSGDDYISGYKDGYNRGVDVGWNRCLDEILGETE